MSTAQRVRAMRRSARNSFYRQQAEWGTSPNLTNWRMIIARKLKIPVSVVRRHLGETEE